MDLKQLQSRCVEQVAGLHIEGIRTGFISSLGVDFVTVLYEAIAESNTSFGFVAEENNKILGFAAFTTNINKLYKSVILKKGLRFAFLLAGKVFSLQQIRKVFETLFYPGRVKKMDLPSAELLSIVVATESQGRGLGSQLLRKGLAECAKRGIGKVKVLVSSDNKPANKLYLKFGFELVGQINSHGVVSNIYVAKTA
jgi:ribosomal protein S18 acetylase RimI-like enzyme